MYMELPVFKDYLLIFMRVVRHGELGCSPKVIYVRKGFGSVTPDSGFLSMTSACRSIHR